MTSENIRFIDQEFGSNGASFRFQLELASSFDDDEVVLLQEDDYLYKAPTWPYHSTISYSELFSEALQYADYVSVYDHPDKYIDAANGGNPQIQQSSGHPGCNFKLPYQNGLVFPNSASTTCDG